MTEVPGQTVQVGTFRVDVTPPLGICMAGSFGIVRARDVAEPLYANALVLDSGAGEVALASVDVCILDAQHCEQICVHIEALAGIPADRVVLTATHTHSGPATGGDAMYETSPEYNDQLARKVASAVRLAQLRKQPARLRVGRAECPEYTFNRRLVQPDGSIVMNWVSPALLQDAEQPGSVDAEVLSLRCDGVDGRPIAFVVNYANHDNAFSGDVISADYSGIMGDCLRAEYGEDVDVLFLPGAAGDVNWLDHRDPDRGRPDLYKEIGQHLARLIVEAPLEDVTGCIDVTRQVLTMPERPYCDYDAAIDGTFGDPDKATAFFEAYRRAYDEYAGAEHAEHAVSVSAVRLGDQLGLCSNPAELFTIFGRQIKAQSPFVHTMVAELSNGHVGYVPASADFAAGGYEVRKLPGNSYLPHDAGDHIVAASVALLRQVQER